MLRSFVHTISMALWINFYDITSLEAQTRYWRFMNKKVISMNQYWSRKLCFIAFSLQFFFSLSLMWKCFYFELECHQFVCGVKMRPVMSSFFSLSQVYQFCGCWKVRSGNFFYIFWKRTKYEKSTMMLVYFFNWNLFTFQAKIIIMLLF